MENSRVSLFFTTYEIVISITMYRAGLSLRGMDSCGLSDSSC